MSIRDKIKEEEEERADRLRRLVDSLPKQPKLTKEQKIIGKALSFIEMATHNNNKDVRNNFLNYAKGLLEALYIQYEKEQNDNNF